MLLNFGPLISVMESTLEILCQHDDQNGKKAFIISQPCASLIKLLQIITITILSLLLPLAFLLLARLKTAHCLLAVVSVFPTKQPLSLQASLFLYTDGSLQYILVIYVTAAALVHGLTGKLLITQSSPVVRQRRLHAAWIFVFAFQVCVCTGIEGTIAAGVDASGFGVQDERNLMIFISRLLFFLGLHESMLYWSKAFVKPIVDDALFGFPAEERWIERAVMTLGFATLWWWRLRDEIESLVSNVTTELSLDFSKFAGWWLYYLTATMGVVTVVKGLFWIGNTILVCRRVEGNYGDSDHHGDDKV